MAALVKPKVKYNEHSGVYSKPERLVTLNGFTFSISRARKGLSEKSV